MSKDSKFIQLASLYLNRKKGGEITHDNIENANIERQIAEGPGAHQSFTNMRNVTIRDSYCGPDASRHNMSLLIRHISLSGNDKAIELIPFLTKIIDISNPAEQKSNYRKLLEYIALHNDAIGPLATSAITLAATIISNIPG
jgi:hypothetical protein